MDPIPKREVWLYDPPRGLIARSLTLKDLSKVKHLAEGCFTKRWSEADYRYFLTSESGRCFGLLREDELVGYALTLVAQGDIDLISIATHPKHLRKGVASWLLHALTKMPDAERIYLEVDETNSVARALYEKHGFYVYGKRKKYYDAQRDAILMQLRPVK